MNINWNRYIIEHLPISLRKIGIYALLKVLLSPILYVYNKYVTYSNKMRQQSAYTPQVCMLVKIIHDELGLISTIEESDGKPYDFRVVVDVANTDVERRLIALISKYKLAGKNFVLNNAAITWQQVWDNYQCEKNDISYVFANYVCERFDLSYQFSDYVCEQIVKTDVTLRAQIIGYGNEAKIKSPIIINDPIVLRFYKQNDANVYYTTVNSIDIEWTQTEPNYYYALVSVPYPSRFEQGSFALQTTETEHYMLTLINEAQ